MSQVASKMDESHYLEMKNAQKFFQEAILACKEGKVESFVSLLENFEESNQHMKISRSDIIKDFQSEGRTLLHIACSCGQIEITKFLLNESSTIENLVNLKDKLGMTPLILATIAESNEIMRLLLQYGADVNACNYDGAAAVHFAASDGNTYRLQILSEFNANLAISSTAGNPLHWAAGRGHADAVQYLIDKGLPVNELSPKGLPAIVMAAAARSDESVCKFLDANADIGYILSGNLTVLHLAAENGLIEAVQRILSADKDNKIRMIETDDGNLAIHLAAMSANDKLVDLMIDFYPEVIDPYREKSREDIIHEIIREGQVRLAQWEQKHHQTYEKSKNNVVTSESMAPAKSEEDKRRAEEHKQLGNKYFVAKQFDRAVDEYTKAILLHGNNEVLWSNRSACYLAMNDPERALADAEVCRNLAPAWVKGCYRLAAARFALKRYEDAAVAALEGCKLDESNSELKKLLQDSVRILQEEHRNNQPK